MTESQPAGYLAVPPTGSGPGVLVLHAWWGLNDTVKSLCDRLAEEGFTAFAPDLFKGRIADTPEGAEALVKEFDGERTIGAVAGAAEFLKGRTGRDGIAVMGFSFGAAYALGLSDALPDTVRSVVLYYGTGPDDFSRSRAAYQGHFAANDPYEPLEYVDGLEEALRKAGRPVEFHRYPGVGHWFFEADRPDAYDAEAANLAWTRTLDFLKRQNGAV